MKNNWYRCESCNKACNYRVSGLCWICNHEVGYIKKQMVAGRTIHQIRSDKGIKPKKKSISERLGALK